jgi:alanine racemase
MINLVFGIPWWAFLGFALAGAALFWFAQNRQQTPLKNAGAAVALLGVAMLIASHFVETDKQKCLRQTHEVAKSVQTRNWSQLTPLLDPRVSLNLPSGSPYINRDDLLKGMQDGVEQYGLKDVAVLSAVANQTQTIITVNMSVLTQQDATMGQPVRSDWELEWQQHGPRWLLARISCQRIGDMDMTEMRNLFPR